MSHYNIRIPNAGYYDDTCPCGQVYHRWDVPSYLPSGYTFPEPCECGRLIRVYTRLRPGFEGARGGLREWDETLRECYLIEFIEPEQPAR